MTLTTRDKRALVFLGVAATGFVVYLLSGSSTPVAPTVAASTSTRTIPEAEARLAKMRQSVARVPGKDEVLKQATDELAAREKGLLQADTANQAQAQLLQIVRTAAETEHIEIRSQELGPPHAFGESYGEVTVAINFECRIEQLVNLLAGLSARQELVATSDVRMSAGNPKLKTVNVRLGVAGIVPRKLVPERRATSL